MAKTTATAGASVLEAHALFFSPPERKRSASQWASSDALVSSIKLILTGSRSGLSVHIATALPRVAEAKHRLEMPCLGCEAPMSSGGCSLRSFHRMGRFLWITRAPGDAQATPKQVSWRRMPMLWMKQYSRLEMFNLANTPPAGSEVKVLPKGTLNSSSNLP